MSKDPQDPIPFPGADAGTEDPSNGTSSKTQPKSPWLFRFGRFAYCRKAKNGLPVIMAANGFVKLSDRLFWEHRMKPGHVVQISKEWDAKYGNCFAQIEKIFIASADIVIPAPAKDGAIMLRLRNVPVEALTYVGDNSTRKLKGTRRRNPRKLIAKDGKK